VFVARPPAGPPLHHDLHLVRAGRRSFTGSAEFLADADNRARVGEYLADMGRPYGREVPASPFGEPPSPDLGHSYGEMAEALIGSVVPADEPVDLLVLAFSVHDLRPGRQTAAYLSHVTPGEPMAFAVCDQGSAAAFSGLRIAREYAASAAIRRALLVVVEQAALPYDGPATLPLQHQAVAMLYADGLDGDGLDGDGLDGDGLDGDGLDGDGLDGDGLDGDGAIWPARVAGVYQHPGVPPGDVAAHAAADLAELAASRHDVVLVLSDALAAVWTAPAAGRVRAMPPGQPSTDVWWGLIDELTRDADTASRPGLLVAADYDPHLRYLCLTAIDTGARVR
jgi:4-hydroxymandelate oxidase